MRIGQCTYRHQMAASAFLCNIPSEKVVGWMSLVQHTDKDSQVNASYLLQQKPWKGGCHWCLSFLDGPILEEDVMSMIFTVRDHMKR